jgi:hypothetical protein
MEYDQLADLEQYSNNLVPVYNLLLPLESYIRAVENKAKPLQLRQVSFVEFESVDEESTDGASVTDDLPGEICRVCYCPALEARLAESFERFIALYHDPLWGSMLELLNPGREKNSSPTDEFQYTDTDADLSENDGDNSGYSSRGAPGSNGGLGGNSSAGSGTGSGGGSGNQGSDGSGDSSCSGGHSGSGNGNNNDGSSTGTQFSSQRRRGTKEAFRCSYNIRFHNTYGSRNPSSRWHKCETKRLVNFSDVL